MTVKVSCYMCSGTTKQFKENCKWCKGTGEREVSDEEGKRLLLQKQIRDNKV